ncbi:TRAP transporter substrate-binding protein DctP [Hoeflea sp.]|uniref:TRAP transporter substrate-binding protein DctP n=1 Tax=Hoeflea sp. TaxID=1940281 RepID=UPI0019CED4D0|nr:TRAP transporter substrate-binding protein DctP [Hoeflea sp.]MBC7284908.1 TRAP transporter substrate-binding protein DctP [Hoeflea sp.]
MTAAVAAWLVAVPATAEEYTIDISLDTGPTHLRNLLAHEIAAKIENASEGRLKFNFFEGGSQYNDQDVPTALAQGAIDMALPGHWNLARIVPDYNVLGLPMFYGRPREAHYRVTDGETGAALARETEQKLGVVVLGKWMDLGFGVMFFTDKAVKEPEDLKGLKMRSPGGAVALARFEKFGATGVSIPFPDVPQALQKGTIDGLMSTFESVRSSKLWDSGLRFSYSDYHAFYQYVPLVSAQAWNELPDDLKEIMRTTWNEGVMAAREAAAEAQSAAAEEAAAHGLTNVSAAESDLAALRASLMADQPRLAKELRVDPGIIELAEKELEK